MTIPETCRRRPQLKEKPLNLPKIVLYFNVMGDLETRAGGVVPA